MQRILEPEVMDTDTEAVEYDAMDFAEVNTNFAQKVIEISTLEAKVLDLGTGTARIPIIIAQQRPKWQITAIDLAHSMLKIALKNVRENNLEDQITLELKDAKNLPYLPHSFDVVISNSLIHHLPDPMPFLREIKKVVKSNGTIVIRDLIRPNNKESLNQIVEQLGQDYDHHQKKLFADSLHAAFTLEEVKKLIKIAGLNGVKVYQSSDIHWTAERAYYYL
jgi:ubiquinone/menaquinone biosynthesis C-methylase UbiE